MKRTESEIKKLRAMHAKVMKADNSLLQPEAVAIRKRIIQIASIQDSHCQSCGRHTESNRFNEGYSECCNELIISGGCHADHCFHVA